MEEKPSQAHSEDKLEEPAFKILPFGTIIVSKIFQSQLKELRKDAKNIIHFTDECLVSRSIQGSYSEILKEVQLDVIKARCSKEKYNFCLQAIDFLEKYINKGSMRSNEDKVWSISELKTPTADAECRHILAIVNCFMWYLLNLFTVLKPLNELWRRDID